MARTTEPISETGAVFDSDVRYCWIDEDGGRVSPVHRDLGKAISWASTWQDFKDRVEAKAKRTTEQFENDKRAAQESGRPLQDYTVRHFEEDTEKIQEARKRITLTGKPPAAMRRLVTRTTVEQPSAEEAQISEQIARLIDG